jgi:hypothetical protein
MVTGGSFEASNGNTMITGQEPDEDWLRRSREIITAYNENRAPDPFMKWFGKEILNCYGYLDKSFFNT